MTPTDWAVIARTRCGVVLVRLEEVRAPATRTRFVISVARQTGQLLSLENFDGAAAAPAEPLGGFVLPLFRRSIQVLAEVRVLSLH